MTPEPNSFLGEYRYTIDDKGRVNIPAPFRKILHPSNNKTFVISKNMAGEKCLVAMPVEEWDKIQENLIRNLNKISLTDQQFMRNLTRYATYCRHDGQGRITIPQNLLEVAGLTKDAVIIGMLNQIEIWDPGELDARMSDDAKLSEEELTALAEKIVL